MKSLFQSLTVIATSAGTLTTPVRTLALSSPISGIFGPEDEEVAMKATNNKKETSFDFLSARREL